MPSSIIWVQNSVTPLCARMQGCQPMISQDAIQAWICGMPRHRVILDIRWRSRGSTAMHPFTRQNNVDAAFALTLTKINSVTIPGCDCPAVSRASGIKSNFFRDKAAHERCGGHIGGGPRNRTIDRAALRRDGKDYCDRSAKARRASAFWHRKIAAWIKPS